jgi:uncharacterized protein (DUF2141 family)
MSRRFILTLTAAAALVAGAGAASATTTHGTAQAPSAAVKAHQLCLLLYRDDPQPQHICVNW